MLYKYFSGRKVKINMKKLLALLLVMAMATSFVACGKTEVIEDEKTPVENQEIEAPVEDEKAPAEEAQGNRKSG